MKKTTALLLIVLLLLCTCACGKADIQSDTQGEPAAEPADDTPSDDSGTGETADSLTLLEGYPEDVLPLYESTAIKSCGFTYRDDPNFVIGKDFYDAIYTSDATLTEISEYYQSLLTHMDEYSTEDLIEGDIGEHHVFVSINDCGEGVMDVDLTVGLAQDEYRDENPFYADLPEALVEVHGLVRLQEISYIHSLYSADEIRYLTIYETDLAEDGFVDFYQTKYGEMEGFTESRDDYNLTYQWVDRGYACSVSYSPGDYAFVNIEINPIEE